MKTLNRPMPPAIDARLDLPARPGAGRAAREAVDAWLADILDPPAAADVRLAASEIVTNAVVHGRLGSEAALHLRLTVVEDTVRIEAMQRTWAPAVRVVPAEERGPTGGFGLAIVALVADRWGSDVGPPGRVWFEIDLV